MLKVTLESDGADGSPKGTFSMELPDEHTWTGIIEDAVIPILRGLTYSLPDTDTLMEAIEKVGEE